MAECNDYHAQKTGALVNLIVSIVKSNPQSLDNIDFLKAQLAMAMPELRDKSTCANCGASMKEYVYTFDVWDAVLLLRMAEQISNRRQKGHPFTSANQIKVHDLSVSYAVKSRTTQASKLGLLAQLKNDKDKRVAGVWVITRRGWQALAGKPVPKKVKVWRASIEERFDETVTIAEALKSHAYFVNKSLSKGRKPKQDYRKDADEYDPARWYEFTIHQGALL